MTHHAGPNNNPPKFQSPGDLRRHGGDLCALDSATSAASLKDRLLAYCEAQYRAIERRQPDGEHIGKGIRLASGIVGSAEMQPDPRGYLESLKRALMDAKRSVRGTAEDDPYGWVLGGIQTVVNEVDKELKKLGGP